ncbi:bacterial lipoate protein ligase c-terminus [Lucifera butyrica]|uniref:lipoate--protein ligase n=1 Tax=Lucifera butyrica TaxID=1351585 RepID=A0A498RHQ5_9FIRM|nr:lipoate--protein ligase [Lucifera butyrica]VBB09622.1 bacterial lipoate protein ligase c-terminus [Lucifera butyrica]
MIFVEHNNTNPYRNHAIEEFLMSTLNEDCFMLWKNEKCILIGRNQNAYNEINLNYVKEHAIPVVRRITGGGAVFNDAGNFNFTFISCRADENFADFNKFTAPILAALKKLGIQAELSGRNDLTIEGKKFSGNAQCKYKNKVLHHGTLLFAADVSELANALTVNDIKLDSKGIKSVKSRVVNISDFLAFPMSIDEFREYLFNEVLSNTENAERYSITDEDWREIDRITEAKYATWQWNFGTSPQFNLKREKRFAGGIVQAYLEVYKGRIQDVRIYGDFFSEKGVSQLEAALKGLEYNYAVLYTALQDFTMDEHIKNVTLENMLEVLI